MRSSQPSTLNWNPKTTEFPNGILEVGLSALLIATVVRIGNNRHGRGKSSEYSPKMLTVPGWVRKAEGSAEAGEVGLILELLDPIS